MGFLEGGRIIFGGIPDFIEAPPRLPRGSIQFLLPGEIIIPRAVIPRRSPNSNISKVASYGKVASWLKNHSVESVKASSTPCDYLI